MSDMETETETEPLTPTPHDLMNQTQPQHMLHQPIQRNPYSSQSHRCKTNRTKTNLTKPKSQHYQSKKSLQTWLHFACKGILTDHPMSPPLSSPQNDANEDGQTNSDHWGDPLKKEKADGII